MKAVDPTLGLYADYAYAQSGHVEGIKSVYGIMRRALEPMVFDIALLAGRIDAQRDGIAPFCPMLAQGWALLDAQGVELPAAVRAAGRHLTPSLWTTFARDGVELLWQAIDQGDIR
jgi:hypothetical protein